MTDAHKYTNVTRRSRIAALHAEGLTNAQMAERLKVGKSAIASGMTKLGLIENEAAPRPDRADVSLAVTPWDAIPGSARTETAPRDGTMVGAGLSKAERNLLAIRAAHRAIMAGGAA